MTRPLIDLTVQLHAKTDRAILVSNDGDEKSAVWLPLSQCEVEILKDGIAEVTMPEQRPRTHQAGQARWRGGMSQVAAKYTPGPWHPGHLGSDSSCQCVHVVEECYAGGICTIHIGNGKPVGDGGNDAPPRDEAIANMRLIAARRRWATRSMV